MDGNTGANEMSGSQQTKKTNPVYDAMMARPGQTITIDNHQYIRVGGSTWKNAELQIVHVDLIMDADPGKSAGEMREVKALVRVFKNE